MHQKCDYKILSDFTKINCGRILVLQRTKLENNNYIQLHTKKMTNLNLRNMHSNNYSTLEVYSITLASRLIQEKRTSRVRIQTATLSS